MNVRYWAGILLSPLTFLLQLSVSYALAGKGCSGVMFMLITLSIGVSLLVALVMAVYSWRLWAEETEALPALAAAAAANGSRSLLAVLALTINVLISLVVIAQWLTVYSDPACGF
jgi:hypothetical protein